MSKMKVADDGTVFLPLLREMKTPIAGGCQCKFCREHPHLVPMWDTLAGHPDDRHTWKVHYPELHH